MGSQTQVSYYLPMTKVRLRCTVTTTHDTILDRESTAMSGWSAELVTVADPAAPRSLVLDSGTWRDYALTLGLTPDGRLTQAGVESTGQAGKVLAGAATLAVAAIAMAAGQPQLAAGVAAGARDSLFANRPPVVDWEELLGNFTEVERAAVDPVEVAYVKAHPAASSRLAALTAERADTQGAVDDARKAYLAAAGSPDRWAAQQGYQASRSVLADVEGELDKAKAHFEAWRKSTFTESATVRDLLVPLGALPRFDGDELTFDEGDDGEAVRELFAAAGRVLAVTAAPRPPVSTEVSAVETVLRTATAALHVRRPRMVELVTVTGKDAAAVCVTAVTRELVMDAACEESHLAVRKSWFAKRRTDIQLSEQGALTGLEFNGESSLAAATGAAAEAATSAPAQLESAAKGRAALASLASAPQEAELARLKRQVAIAEQRLLAAGQAATTADYAELQRSKQDAEIAELKVKLHQSTAALEAAQQA